MVTLTKDAKETFIDEENIFYPPSEDGLHVSEEVYWADYYELPESNYEWNNGILEEKGPSNRYTYLMYMWFRQLLKEYLNHYPIAETIALQLGGRVFHADKCSIRKPDLWVLLKNNPVPFEGKETWFRGTFDIAIEAISKEDEKYILRDTVIKKQEYALGGVKEYYILDGDGTKTAFYRLNKQGNYEEIKSKDGIIRSEVLPNFQFRISDLYERPPIDQLVYDEVYKHFVDRRFQEEAKARQQAEAEIERLKALLNKQN